MSQIKATVQNASNKLYTVGGKHIAGQHSLTTGEAICVVIAGIMIFAPTLFKKIPLVGKYASVTAAFIILILALVIW